MRYRVKALRPGEGVTSLTMEAIDADEVTARLQRGGLQVVGQEVARVALQHSHLVGDTIGGE